MIKIFFKMRQQFHVVPKKYLHTGVASSGLAINLVQVKLLCRKLAKPLLKLWP